MGYQQAFSMTRDGRALLRAGRFQEAVETLNRAIQYDADIAETWTTKAIALSELGRHAEAIEAHDEALRLDPTIAGAWYNKATTLVHMGRYEDAVQTFDRALALDPKDGIYLDKQGYRSHASWALRRCGGCCRTRLVT